ncbi:WXG100 family type VII secretion target [Streptomyces sp. NPDC020096]
MTNTDTGFSELSMKYTGVASLAGDVKQAAKFIHDELENLQQRVTRQTASWSGEAKTAYHSLQKDWDRQAADLQAALDAIATVLEQLPDAYRGTDQKIAKSFQI